MNALIKYSLTISFSVGTISAAVPVQKSGPCPPLTRHSVDTSQHWANFPVRPNPLDSFPLLTVQDPLTPAQSINCIEPATGLKAVLWASEEMTGHIAYVQHFAFDERGRLWAVEPRSYPNNPRAASGTIDDDKFRGGDDRIVIMEDTDHDGIMDSLKVFRDGLNLPQSIEVVNGGVVVGMAPYLVFFPNHQDSAGTPEILFAGMGSNGPNYDTQGGISSLMYGLDNWIYGHTGYNTNCTVQGINCGGGKVWRFRHTSLGHAKTEFEIWSQGPSNAWGMGQMEDGQIFQSGASGTSHMNHAAVQGQKALDIRTVNTQVEGSHPKQVFYPITGDRFLWEGSTGKNSQGWFISTTTGVSGLQFYTARLFPRKYWNRFAFTCEGASKLCNQDSLVESSSDSLIGSSWQAIRLPGPEHANLLASRDAWVAPILAKTGPDGAVWVLDWNTYNTLHNPNIPAGKGGAWINELRDKHTNRIYRLVPEGTTPDPILDLSHDSEDDLIAQFSNTNFFWRLTAQRLLIGKGYSESLGGKLKTILQTVSCLDAVGNCPPVQHALWTLEGLGQFTKDPATWNPILANLLTHPAWCVRRNVLRILPRTAASATAIDSACTVNDEHGHVRLQALLALAEIATKPAAMRAMWTQYKEVDALADSAFAHSGLTDAQTLLCSRPAGSWQLVAFPMPTTGLQGAPLGSVARSNLVLLWQSQPGGFRLLPYASLASGVLKVFDLQGRLAFSSRYDAVHSAWSVEAARGLEKTLYAYEFRGASGASRCGKLSLINSH